MLPPQAGRSSLSILKWFVSLVLAAVAGGLVTYKVEMHMKQTDKTSELLRIIAMTQHEVNYRLQEIDRLMYAQQASGKNNYSSVYLDIPLGPVEQIQKLIENTAFFECATCTYESLMSIQKTLSKLESERTKDSTTYSSLKPDDSCVFYQVYHVKNIYVGLQGTLTQYDLHLTGAQDRQTMYKNLADFAKAQLEKAKNNLRFVKELAKDGRCFQEVN